MRMALQLSASVLLCSSVACIDDNPASSDGVETEAAIAATSGPRVHVRTTPEEGATAVPPQSNIVVEFSEPVRPDTVNGFTVALWSPRFLDARQRSSLTLDASRRRLTINPAWPFERGLNRLEIDGVRTASGKSVRHTLRFVPMNNEEILSRRFATDGSEALRTETTLDRRGRPTVRLTKVGSEIRDRTTWRYRAPIVRPVVRTVFDGPGDDGAWGTADDHISDSVRFGYDHEQRLDLEVYSDADGIYEYARNYVVNPTLAFFDGFQDPGADGEWLTADDPMTYFYRSSVADPGDPDSYDLRGYSAPGADGIWRNDDDFMDVWARSVPGGGDRNRGPGPDGIWETDDDEDFGDLIRFNPDGTLGFVLFVTDSGPDREFGTPDDVLDGAQRFFYRDGMRIFAETLSAPGPDGAWDTADDVVNGYELTSVDHRGVTSRVIFVDDAGPDGVWQTSDDHRASERIFETRR